MAIQLTTQNNLYTLGVLIALSKTFDTIDHTILLKKLKIYDTKGSNHNSIKSYLLHRNQYVEKDPTKITSFEKRVELPNEQHEYPYYLRNSYQIVLQKRCS